MKFPWEFREWELLISFYLKEDEVTPTLPRLCALVTGHDEFRNKMKQSLDAWKNLATVSSSRSTSLLTFLLRGMEKIYELNIKVS